MAASLFQEWNAAFDAIGTGQEETAIARLEPLAGSAAAEPRFWQALGLLYRATDDGVRALSAFDKAVALAPHDASILNGRAQVRLETGLDAVADFEALLRLGPSLQAMQGMAAALAQAGRGHEAVAFLDRALDQNPSWGEGHWLASRLRWQFGDRDGYLASLDRAQAREPRNAVLWQLRLAIQFRATFFAQALETVNRARAALGAQAFLDESEAIALSETGAVAQADDRFGRLAPAADLNGLLYRMRHALRAGRPDECGTLAAPVLETDSAIYAWSYVSIAWRMLGDPRHEWLEGQPGLVGTYDLAGALPMAELRRVVEGLHAAGGHPLEQSVRDGTQTDGALFSRGEPAIRALREAVLGAYRTHIAALPPRDLRHPQLGPRRDGPLRFAAAWSIRLRDKGRHVSHIHPYGWFSSAFYVAVPAPAERGPAPSGWLVLGEPEEGLGVSLPQLGAIEPRDGLLAIFPSTMWHGTRPFGSGLRMTVAFDIARPPA